MSNALVVLSGGQDSTTCAAIAQQQHDRVSAIVFHYGQRHAVEIESARAVARELGLYDLEEIDLGPVLKSTSPLVSDTPLGQYDAPELLPQGIEPTFVPARNLLFLTVAANRAAAADVRDIYTGLCEEDYGGYPDCRRSFVDAMERAIGEGVYGEPDAVRIHTPLMRLTKSASVKLALEVLGDRFERVFEQTHTCYAGIKGGCGKCHACILRDRGFREAGIVDPIWKYRRTS